MASNTKFSAQMGKMCMFENGHARVETRILNKNAGVPKNAGGFFKHW